MSMSVSGGGNTPWIRRELIKREDELPEVEDNTPDVEDADAPGDVSGSRSADGAEGDGGNIPAPSGENKPLDASFLFNNLAVLARNELMKEGFTTAQIIQYFEFDEASKTYKVKPGVVDNNGNAITDKQQLKDFLGVDAKQALKAEGFHDEFINTFFEAVSGDGKTTEFKLREPYTRYEITSNEAGADEITLYADDENFYVKITVDLNGNMTIDKKNGIPQSIKDALNDAINNTYNVFGEDGAVPEMKDAVSVGIPIDARDRFLQNDAKMNFERNYGLDADECIAAGYVELVKDESTGRYNIEFKKGNVREDGKLITNMEELAEYLGGDELKAMRDKGVTEDAIDVFFERVMGDDGNYTYKPIGDYAGYEITDDGSIKLLNDKGHCVKQIFMNEDGSFNVRKPDYSLMMRPDGIVTKEVFKRDGEVGAMTEAEARAEYKQLDDATFDKFFEIVEENGVFYVDPKSPYTLTDTSEEYYRSPYAGGFSGVVKTYVLTAYDGSGTVTISGSGEGTVKVTYRDANGNAIDSDGSINTNAIDLSDIPGYKDNTRLHERGKGWNGSLDKMKDVATDILNNDSLKSQLEAQFRAACAAKGIKFSSQQFRAFYNQAMESTLNSGIITGRGARGLSSKGHAYCDTRVLVDTFLAKFDALVKNLQKKEGSEVS